MVTMTALSADPICREHLAGRFHPERPERFDAVLDALRQAGALERLIQIHPRAATEEELLLCHTPAYLKTARHDVESGAEFLSTGDTDITANSWEVAEHAAGGVLNAVDAVMGGRAHNAFCLVRPPGHHATASRGMGFCLFNNIALAARYAQRRYGVERVLIVDWDVHVRELVKAGIGLREGVTANRIVLFVHGAGHRPRSPSTFRSRTIAGCAILLGPASTFSRWTSPATAGPHGRRR